MASDDEDNLFASSDEEAHKEDENGVNYEEETRQQVEDEDDVNALFDDEDDDNDNQLAPARDGAASYEQQRGGTDAEKSEEEEPARPKKIMAPPIDISAPLVPLPPSEKTFLMKTGNIVDFESRPFDPDTFQAEEEVYQDEMGVKRIRLRDQNVARWRWRKEANGRMERESNARFVKWSDKSWQLLLGDEVLDVAQLDMTRDHAYLYVLHGGTLQGQAQLRSKLQCRPASLDSRSHKRLREMVEKKHGKVFRVGKHVALTDPEKDKASKEKAAQEAIRNREVVARKQERTAAQYSRPVYRSSALTVQDLEQADDDDAMVYEPSQLPSHLRRTYDDEGEGARKLMAAQHAIHAQHKHRRTIEEDDDDQEEEQDDRGVGYEEEEEEQARKKSRQGSYYGSEGRDRPREKERPKDKGKPKVKRGVVMSSDEDD